MINSILPYYGGKRSMAKDIVQEFGHHKIYYELCCGSLAIIMKKPICANEILYDRYGALVNLARVIQHDELHLVFKDKCQRTLYHQTIRSEHEIKRQSYTDDQFDPESPDVDAAHSLFVSSWMGFNGITGTAGKNTSFSYSRGPKSSAAYYVSATNSIDAWHERLRRVHILNKDIFDSIDSFHDNIGTVIYADPPYYEKTAKYIHDFTPEQHHLLAQKLSRFKNARVVVSYYDHEEIRKIYDGWNIIEKPMRQMLTSGEKKKTAQEILIINGPSYVNI